MVSIASELFACKVYTNEMISQTSAVIQLGKKFDFLPGQVIGITTHKEIQPRLYSIAGSRDSQFYDILYKVIPYGELTPELQDVSVNEKVFITKPFGNFIINEDATWLIATGTGIAPFISAIKSGNVNKKVVIHGSRMKEDFYYSDLLKEQLGENYIRCYTGDEECNYFRGRVTQYLMSVKTLPKYIKYYLCGSAEMVVNTRQLLISRGIPFQNIHSEIYF